MRSRSPAPDFALAVVKGISHLAPHAHVLKLHNEDFSRDPKALKAKNEDPLIANEVQPTATIAALVRADERLKSEFPLIKLPVFILHGTADKVTKPSGSQEFYDKAGSKDKTLKLYEGHYHDLLNDIGKEQVMADIIELDRQASAACLRVSGHECKLPPTPTCSRLSGIATGARSDFNRSDRALRSTGGVPCIWIDSRRERIVCIVAYAGDRNTLLWHENIDGSIA